MHRVYGKPNPDGFPEKPLPPIFLGPPKPNGAVPARETIIRYVSPTRIGVAPEAYPPEIPVAPAALLSTVWGLITECSSGRAIEGATVVLEGVSRKTDAQGKYEFRDVEPGNFALYAYKD